jgi:adenine-specific DNA methylase
MHKYWSKKPFNIMRQFIQTYSTPGDVVIDPFCGSGVSIAEAIFAGRKAVGIDINPVATFITRQLLAKIPIGELENDFTRIQVACKDTINSYYEVQRGGESFTATHYLWNNDELEEVWYKRGREKIVESVDESDVLLATSFTYEQIPHYYPTRQLLFNTRINVGPNLHLHELFTPRNLAALALLFHEISQEASPVIRDILKFCFTAALGQASKMVFVVKRRGKMKGKTSRALRKEIGSWVIGYWVPQEHFEINVWNCFENRFRKIYRAKKDQENLGYSLEECQSPVDLLSTPANLLLETGSAIDIMEEFPNDSVDYVVTDPPHGDRIPYLELSLLWNEWLGFDADFAREIIISDAKERQKDVSDYEHLLGAALREIERILKPDKFFTLMFNSLDDRTWMFLMQEISSMRLSLLSVDTLQYSLGSVVQDSRRGGLKTDFIFTFQKKLGTEPSSLAIISPAEVEELVTNTIAIRNLERGCNPPIFEILNEVIVNLLARSEFCHLDDLLAAIKTASPILRG